MMHPVNGQSSWDVEALRRVSSATQEGTVALNAPVLNACLCLIAGPTVRPPRA